MLHMTWGSKSWTWMGPMDPPHADSDSHTDSHRVSRKSVLVTGADRVFEICYKLQITTIMCRAKSPLVVTVAVTLPADDAPHHVQRLLRRAAAILEHCCAKLCALHCEVLMRMQLVPAEEDSVIRTRGANGLLQHPTPQYDSWCAQYLIMNAPSPTGIM